MGADGQKLELTQKGQKVLDFIKEIGEDGWREINERAIRAGLGDMPLSELFDWMMANQESAKCPTAE
jgi:hypothetical protein